jgi:hypothetical protein
MNIRQYQAARYPFLWLTTTEEERTIRAHRAQLKETARVFSWDIAAGFQELAPNGEKGQYIWKKAQDETTTSPGAALLEILTMPENSIYYLKDYHKYFEDITVVRRALNIKETLKATARLVCFISCMGQAAIPAELKNDICPFIPPMPTREELAETIKRIAADNEEKGIKQPTPKELDALSNALIGLTEETAENALSLCLVQLKKFDAKVLLKEKARLIQSTSGLTYQEYSETLQDLAGLEVLISYIMKAAPARRPGGDPATRPLF